MSMTRAQEAHHVLLMRAAAPACGHQEHNAWLFMPGGQSRSRSCNRLALRQGCIIDACTVLLPSVILEAAVKSSHLLSLCRVAKLAMPNSSAQSAHYKRPP